MTTSLIETEERVLVVGRADLERCDNQVCTSKYTIFTFLPMAVSEQFRRVANMYFLIMGFIMAIGWYTPAFESAINPWTLLGPLALVVSFSLTQEALADIRRHQSDEVTNNYECVVLRRSEELDNEGGIRESTVRGGKDVEVNLDKWRYAEPNFPRTPMGSSDARCNVAFQSVKRKNIRQGHIVMIRNRDMVPADLILLASSAENGVAYIETMSIDGETNLKLRTSPRLPENVARILHQSSERNFSNFEDNRIVLETLEKATSRICRLTALGFPNAVSSLDNPSNSVRQESVEDTPPSPGRVLNLVGKGKSVLEEIRKKSFSGHSSLSASGDFSQHCKYITALKSEPPNASVNTFNGVLWLPPLDDRGGASIEIPLNGENMLLRGAVLRNTEWAIGIACYTGKDTKLVRNSFDTPSKFSRLDQLTNSVVYGVLGVMVLCITGLATFSSYTYNADFQNLWYLGFNSDEKGKWPSLPNLASPSWETSIPNWAQTFFLFVTLLSQFLPISLYVTLEFVTLTSRLFLNLDVNMYDPVTDTRTLARSTAVSDLGQVEYIFSDKTGTLTQNVMKFKRCSIDGKIFGSPIVMMTKSDAEESPTHEYQPLDNLMMGTSLSGNSSRSSTLKNAVALTFNTEMFLRVMSLCHTVVVEKDLDATKGVIDATDDAIIRDSTNRSGRAGITSKLGFLLSPRSRNSSSIQESFESNKSDSKDSGRSPPTQTEENAQSEKGKGKDGAPAGFAFQAESPDEGALVEASSLLFDFQVVRRDASGITLSVNVPTVFSSTQVVEGIKNGTLTEESMAASSVLPGRENDLALHNTEGPREETWEVLAVNRFDSTRKRMSILVRSPASLGSLPMLLCKGADSSMLDSKVLRNASHAVSGDENELDIAWKVCAPAEFFEGEWDRTATLSLQAHLGEFAREGLRTLVLGMRILNEKECAEWLETYNTAATSLRNREEKLTTAALQIERNLHIVGATAIEDKLQESVPETIAMLSKAGIKLWILTGDKRETAKEIGYATNVLTEKMRSGLIEVVPGSPDVVRTRLAMEFWKLVKYAKIPEYQKRSTDKDSPSAFDEFLFRISKFKRYVSRQLRRFYYKYIRTMFFCFYSKIDPVDDNLQAIIEEEKKEKDIIRVADRRRNVRNRAEKIVRDYINSPDGMAARQSRNRIDTAMEIRVEDMKMPRSEGPDVFNRACNAEVILRERQISELTPVKLGALSGGLRDSLVDRDVLSMKSLAPADGSEISKDFDSRKRSILERAFAVDKDVRHGRLMRHLTREKLSSIMEEDVKAAPEDKEQTSDRGNLDGPRGLVIEGEALEHMLGDSELEEILFAVANTCDSVIACRVSPSQKAKLVKLVRRYVEPEPVTLAIGDGANDVGMIQAAHVGVGISGKEGAQAVNASDFALAQFRFLQDLLLVHGRWNVNRLVTAMLFSFYKNAVITGCLIIYSSETLCSGTPFFDSWLISTFNFLTMVPIWTLGALDRCLDRDYIKAHPEVYTPTRRNEVLKNRVLIRWILLTIAHVGIVYYLSVNSLALAGAGNSSAFNGLMSNQQHDRPGDGEGGDLKSVGFVAFSSVILLMGYKVLYESRSIIIGEWPILKFQKGCTESWTDRAPWSIQAVLLGSFAFYVCFIYTYQIGERIGPSIFAEFTDIVYHSWHLRALSWMSMLLVPIAAMAFDVTGKVFGNLFFPTQTQIHVEIFACEAHRKSRKRSDDDKKRSNTEDTKNSYLQSNPMAGVAEGVEDDNYEYLADEDVDRQGSAFPVYELDDDSSEYLA